MTEQKNNYLPLSFEPLFCATDSDTRSILVNNLSDINAQDCSGHTIAMCAARYGDKELIEYCVEHGANFNLQNVFGWTALMFAVANNREDVVSYLLDNVKNIDLTKRTRINDEDVFDIANHRPEKIKAMLYSYLYAKVKNPVAEKVKDANVKTK